jgi:uncharacterized membrane protein YphA (DoxX/SURF4 family)
MLSTFPDLLSYQMFAPLLIRLTLGIILIHWTYKTLRSHPDTNKKMVAIVEGVAGLLLVIGLWTQVAALVIAVDLVIRLFGKYQTKSLLTDGVNYYFILFILALTLLFTGAGFVAIDLPL